MAIVSVLFYDLHVCLFYSVACTYNVAQFEDFARNLEWSTNQCKEKLTGDKMWKKFKVCLLAKIDSVFVLHY